MNMTNDEQAALDALSKAYKAYYLVSKDRKATMDADEYALLCAKGYIEYVKSCQETYPHWTIVGTAKNEIRILRGLIECYEDRDFKMRPKTSNKTRWSL